MSERVSLTATHHSVMSSSSRDISFGRISIIQTEFILPGDGFATSLTLETVSPISFSCDPSHDIWHAD